MTAGADLHRQRNRIVQGTYENPGGGARRHFVRGGTLSGRLSFTQPVWADGRSPARWPRHERWPRPLVPSRSIRSGSPAASATRLSSRHTDRPSMTAWPGSGRLDRDRIAPCRSGFAPMPGRFPLPAARRAPGWSPLTSHRSDSAHDALTSTWADTGLSLELKPPAARTANPQDYLARIDGAIGRPRARHAGLKARRVTFD